MALYIFDDDNAARRFMVQPPRGNLTSPPSDPQYDCHRLAAGRYVIHLYSPYCRGTAVLDVLESAVNEAAGAFVISSSPPGAPPGPTADPVSRVPPADAVLPPEPADVSIDDIADAIPELTPAEIAAVAGTAGGAALLGSLLLLGASGTRREEVLDSIRDLLRGRLPEDPFEAWKRTYEALGWKYSEKNGVATFDPVDGARNEAGEVWSSAKGGFVRADDAPVPTAAPPRDGDVNDRGEVWSDYSRGWVGRNTYEQDQASKAWLADKAQRDLADMQHPDADVADLHRQIAETRRERQAMETFFDARQKLSDALEQQRQREFADGPLSATRSGLFDDIDRRLEDMATRRDFEAGLGDMASLADVIGQQMRDTYKPTYTYRDAVLDTALQTGALAADVFVTKGLASSALGSTLAMRDAVREGADTTGMLLAGAKAAATDYLFGKAAHLGGGYAVEAWTATRRAAGGFTDEVANITGSFRRSHVAGDLVEAAKRNLVALDAGVQRDASGRMRASLSDVLEVQRNPNQVRLLKQQGSLQTQDAFNHTLRNEVYKPHDQMLLERLRQSTPELADRKLMVHEFRTPGKTANPINTDRDFRVLVQDDAGKWIEVPKAKWEQHSNDVFGELTFLDPSKCPKGMNPAEQKAWWAEQHGHTPTDRAFREASRDYSDQTIDAFGRRTQIETPRIAELKDIASKADDIAAGRIPPPAQPVRLADPQALAQQFHEKVTGNLRRGDPFEAIAQAKKGVETLDAVHKAYGAQRLPIGELPANLRSAMDAVAKSNLPAQADAAALAAFEDTLRGHGFRSLEDFSGKLSSQFEALKWAK
ncbi:hypothetical protein [Blastochloris sulfoviridis]|uniref:Uncharacterized protein n=1 Tax=Blastochloris sulfoviridis TaxID=50712 RepID=A0A5M6HJE5_9HYPH|nr:hypothetical protein [Blastochloris sulfoviridis]KAA5595977.1 hypothetical protein F1193_15930 [Blastochloris sulfoviridis]